MKYFDFPAADVNKINVTIDENLREFSVSVAGQNPNITVTDPKKQPYVDGKEILKLDNVKVVNIENPIPGDWKVVTSADSPHSVRLSALSDITFNFGFSLQKPSNLSETLFNPLLGKFDVNVILKRRLIKIKTKLSTD